ncbi:MAG: RNA polymerase sigma-54 factor, partial [Dinghuibacter sp.]|nr:RNA polymerase sigma-54 factor [Dinghuibacter sp.]
MSLYQGLQQKLLQKLSPQQIQLMKLLQIPTAHLEERIKEELEENPALETGETDQDDYEMKDAAEEFGDENDEYEESDTADEFENLDISEYVHEGDDDVADYKTRDDNYPEADEQKTIPIRVETSFNAWMLEQLGMLNLNEKDQKIAEQVVGSLDDDGYLR